MRATVTVERSRLAKGRFANQQSNAAISFDAASDGDGVHITFAQALLARAGEEAWERQADPRKPEGVRSAIGDIDAAGVADMLDFRAPLLRLLSIASTESEARVTYRGAPARLLVLKVTPHLTREATSIFNVRVTEDRLNVWLNDDNLPIAAERVQKGSAGFLFLRGEMTSRQSWSFALVNDRLVVTRHEISFLGSGFGQRGEGRTVEVVTVR